MRMSLKTNSMTATLATVVSTTEVEERQKASVQPCVPLVLLPYPISRYSSIAMLELSSF